MLNGENDGQTLPSNNPAHPRGCRRRRLRAHANAHTTAADRRANARTTAAGCCVNARTTGADRCANAHITAVDRPGADTYDAACCAHKPAANRRATD